MKRIRIIYMGKAGRQHLVLASTLLILLLFFNISFFSTGIQYFDDQENIFQSVNASAERKSAQLAVIITGMRASKQSITDYTNLKREMTFVISPSDQASEDMAKLASAYGCEVILGLSSYECQKLKAEFSTDDNTITTEDPEKHGVHDVFARFPQTQGLDVRPAGNSPYRRFVEEMLPAVSVWGGYILIDDTWADIYSESMSNSVNCDFEIIASKGANSMKRQFAKAAAQARNKGHAVVVLETTGCSSEKISGFLSKQFDTIEKQEIELVPASQFAE